MRYTVSESQVYVVGRIWSGGRATYTYAIPADAGIVTRERVSVWLASNAGDFRSIEDFSASIEHGKETIEIPWEREESETFFDEMERAL